MVLPATPHRVNHTNINNKTIMGRLIIMLITVGIPLLILYFCIIRPIYNFFSNKEKKSTNVKALQSRREDLITKMVDAANRGDSIEEDEIYADIERIDNLLKNS